MTRPTQVEDVYRPSRAVFKRLKTRLIDRRGVGIYYCQHVAQKKRCPRQKGRSCWDCLPTLKAIIEDDFSEANNPQALLRWRLSQYARGKISIRPKEKIKPGPRLVDVDPIKDAPLLVAEILGRGRDEK